jgi:hypothetical protein
MMPLMDSAFGRMATWATLLLLTTPIAAQQVIVADASGLGGHTSSLPHALTLAAPGDIVLLREGAYGLGWGQHLSKPLSIVAEAGATVTIVGNLIIEQLAPGESVFLRGVTLRAGEWHDAGLLVRDCQGTVFVEDCELLGYGGWGVPAFAADGAADVVLSCSSIEGGSASGFYVAVGPVAVVVEHSRVSLYDCLVVGGSSTCKSSTCYAGSPGIWARSGTVIAQGCTLTGGEAGPATWTLFGWIGPPGGNGLLLGQGQPDVQLLDCSLEAGHTMTNWNQPLAIQTGTLVEHQGVAVRVEATSPLPPAGPGTLTVRGAPGALAFLIISLDLAPKTYPGLTQPWLLTSPFLVWNLGPLDAQGELVAPFVAPILPPGGSGLGLSGQAVTLDGLDVVLGDATRFTMLDPS